MVNAVGIQARIDRGSGKAAAKLGEPCDIRRPTSALDGPAPYTAIGSLLAWFNPDADFGRVLPNLYNKPVLGALLDRTSLAVGDYLFGQSSTYFVIAMQPLLATAVVQCNCTIAITRPYGDMAVGPQPYGGRKIGTDVVLMASWPASVLASGRTQAGRADLPSDVPDKGMACLVPAFLGVMLRTSDRVTDDQGRAFVIAAAELSDLGWRLDLVLSVT